MPQDDQQLAYLHVLHHLTAQADQIKECIPSPQAVGILYMVGAELSNVRSDLPWWKRWIAKYNQTTLPDEIAYRPARYRYRHFYAAQLIQLHFRNYKRGQDAGNLFDEDVLFWARMIYDDPEDRRERELLFDILQVKYWQALCRGIEAKLPPPQKKTIPSLETITRDDGACLVKGRKVMHSIRGLGEVVALDWTEKRGKPVFARFDSGEEHHYSLDSALKLKTVTEEEVARLRMSGFPKPLDSAVPYSAVAVQASLRALEQQPHLGWNAQQPASQQASSIAVGTHDFSDQGLLLSTGSPMGHMGHTLGTNPHPPPPGTRGLDMPSPQTPKRASIINSVKLFANGTTPALASLGPLPPLSSNYSLASNTSQPRQASRANGPGKLYTSVPRRAAHLQPTQSQHREFEHKWC